MNCADFETIVNDLAEGRPMDATARVNGLSHAAVCGDCAARLNDAKSLSAALQMATTAETEEAPARVRESLLAAFAEHHNQVVTPLSIQRGSTWGNVRWWSAAAVMAAAAVVILALILPSLMHVSAPATQKPSVAVTYGPAPTAATPIEKNRAVPPPASERKSIVARNTSSVSKPAIARSNPHSIKSNETVAENTTNRYLPLTYLADATAMESGTVVRVQLSRAALSRLGLPVNIEGTNELVKADLVLGDDGVARAIRLVRE